MFLPFLPTVPFLLLTLVCFAKGSERLHKWFVDTNMYKKNLDSFAKKRGITLQAKIRVLISITLLMGVGFIMMHKTTYGRIILGIVWVIHVIYFCFCIKTVSHKEK
ncbi:YbaN family protein [Eubacteriales bacterium KG127]